MYYGPALDLPLGGFGPKMNTNEWGLEYFIPTKFGEFPSSDSVVKSDYAAREFFTKSETFSKSGDHLLIGRITMHYLCLIREIVS